VTRDKGAADRAGRPSFYTRGCGFVNKTSENQSRVPLAANATFAQRDDANTFRLSKLATEVAVESRE
jgi:hypothetical protein